jgi:hypothetical protein
VLLLIDVFARLVQVLMQILPLGGSELAVGPVGPFFLPD